MKALLAMLALCATLAFAQVAITTARMDGTVTDPQGAVVVGADVVVLNTNTGASFKATTDDHGLWILPSMPQARYRVTVSLKGFRTAVIDDVVMDAGVPVTVNAKLEVGAVSETVEVSGAQELVQTNSATVNSSLEKRQLTELPTLSRGGLDLLISLPGIQSASTDRNSTINGLPQGTLSVTVDGLNTQDQELKSSNGYFTYIPIQMDSVEEVVLSTAAAGADSTGEGAAQVKFVTRSGTNEFHGGAFWQNRNTWFTANAYFNTINHLPRNVVQLNQYGFHVGGPVYIPKVLNLKNKLFFFTNVEFRVLPQSGLETRTVITPSAAGGVYTYADSKGVTHTANVLTMAQAAGFPSTPDPSIAKTFSQILALTGNGTLTANGPINGDYNTGNLAYSANGLDRRHLSMTRVDYNLNSRNQISLTYSYNMYYSTPDLLNGVVPIFPGTGDILGTNVNAGQTSNRFMGTVALRTAITSHLTNSFQGGLNGGTVVFFSGTESPALYSQWRGYIPLLSAFGSPNGLSGVTTSTDPQRRNSPVKQFSDTMSWLKGPHMLTFGGDFSQINLWQETFYTETLPQISFGIATGDPVHNGSTDLFTASSMSGATQTQMDQAAALYAVLTGRVNDIYRQVVESESSHQYSYNTPTVDRDQQRQFGLFVQDQWRVAPSFTLNFGMRFEQQMPFENLSGIYTAATMQAAYGISGIGNMYKPGVYTGGLTPNGGAAWAPAIPSFVPLSSTTEYVTPKNWNPNLGFAWQIPATKGLLGRLFGERGGNSVLRAGYSIATVREGSGVFQTIYADNPGISIPTSVDPSTYPQYFGAPGSVLFSQPTLPTYPAPTSPSYPISTTPSSSSWAFDPNLKVGYVESWNVGFQREFGHNNVIEIRYVGNHEVHGWRTVNLNEINTFESGFQTDFYNAYNNLLIARNGNILNTNSNNFSNQGLPGQKAIPILQTALGTLTNNSSYATYLRQNQVGALARVIYANATYMGRLVAAGYPANLFIVNPSVGSSGSELVTNWGKSFYDSGVVEYRRRLASGLQIQANYVFSKALADGATGSSYSYSEPTTFRNLGLDLIPPGYDVRNAFKVNFIYELPFGHGKPFLSGNTVLDKMFGGWQVAGIDRNQSGSPVQLTSGRYGMNQYDNGVVLYNMTTAQLQSMMSVTKTTGAASSSSWGGLGQVWYLPQSLVTNTKAEFETSGLNWTNLNPSAPYFGPQLTPGQFGYRVFLYGPWQNHVDFSLSKRTTFAREKANLLIQANCLNCLNLTDFYLANLGGTSGSLGQTTSAYTDISNTQDPGGRIIEFVVRVNF